ncbi:hypothetical protein N7495_007556 [Penicillium taxi]|uniref:uncharacterized protein n=1 Tax=Penicillium taxi TaxID=168475 RepID=UPI00254542A1|nr:uncharacterized protein N7495_007556 [Penicillium taxi]KAJ5887515.1 hypothetical protein N7495_007556 [Penicillium taxi]
MACQNVRSFEPKFERKDPIEKSFVPVEKRLILIEKRFIPVELDASRIQGSRRHYTIIIGSSSLEKN